MRPEELAKFEEPYDQQKPIEERFATRLGVFVPQTRTLQHEVFADFDESNCGIGWWTPHPGTSRRILISVHMLLCISGIETNLLDARLHLLELLDFDEQQDRIIAHAVKHDSDGQPSVEMPERTRASDDLPHHMATLHIAGFFRAVGSALDCLGAAIVGVVALPTSLLKADLDRAMTALSKVKAPATEGEKVQAAFRAEIDKFILNAGPTGWLPWVMDYRNMLVHRGRRLQMSLLVPRGGLLFSADQRPIMLVRAMRQLAQDPGLSEIEVFASNAVPVLTEDSRTTLEGIVESTLALIEKTAAELVGIWRRRRATPSLLQQPKNQWRDGLSSGTRGFAGYKPGTLPFKMDALVTHEAFIRRLKAAALDDGARKRWIKFD